MKYYALTDIGKRRELNEDSYYIPDNGIDVCAVADGMGGHNAGEVASRMAINAFSGSFAKAGPITEERMIKAVINANSGIYAYAEKNKSCRGMGTTLTGLACEDNHVMIAHVGDSSCYLIRNGKLKKITHDHSYVQELVDAGIMTPLQAQNSPYKNYITRAVGTHKGVEPDIYSLTARNNDVFLLCSDGLSNHVTEEEMLRVTVDPDHSMQEKLHTLIEMALNDGGTDNITAVYAVFTEDKK